MLRALKGVKASFHYVHLLTSFDVFKAFFRVSWKPGRLSYPLSYTERCFVKLFGGFNKILRIGKVLLLRKKSLECCWLLKKKESLETADILKLQILLWNANVGGLYNLYHLDFMVRFIAFWYHLNLFFSRDYVLWCLSPWKTQKKCSLVWYTRTGVSLIFGRYLQLVTIKDLGVWLR